MSNAVASLDDNQRACLRLVAQGYTSKQIAQRTSLTPGTVDQYVYRATVALGAKDRREAARILVEAEKNAQFKQFELKPEPLVEPAMAGEKEASAPSRPTRTGDIPAGAERQEKGRLRQLGNRILATMGGEPHGLNRWQILTTIFRVALWAGGALAALITMGYWLNHLFG